MAYGAKDITVLKGLEPVRERPGMYIGSTGLSGLHHLVYEVVDNAVDEAMAGHATRIDVTLLADGGCRVDDNGRGIPVDNHPDYKNKSAAEVVLTVLHAGGKFGGEGYKISGGLHGVGVSVVNALSSRLDLEIHRDGGKWEMSFAKGGKPAGQARAARPRRSGPARSSRSGPTPRSSRRPSSARRRCSSGSARWRSSTRASRSASATSAPTRRRRADLQVRRRHRRLREAPQRVEGADLQARRRVRGRSPTTSEVDVAMQWNTGYHEGIHSFANNIATTEGGMHEEGFKKALTNVVNKYGRGKNLLKEKDDNLLGEDIREGLTAIISVKLRNPQFEGQTKTKLGNTEMRSLVEKVTNEKLGDWLEEHPAEAKQVMAKATQAPRARRRGASGARPHAAQVAARVGGDAGQARRLLVAQPGRVRAVHRRGRQRRRLGQAGARPAYQAILPIRGKILNVERARLDKMLKNEEIQTLDHRDRRRHRRRVRRREDPLPQDHPDDRRRRRRLAHPHAAAHVLLPAAAASSSRQGYVYIAQPPLFRADIGKERDVPQGRGRARARSRPSTRAARSRSAGSRASARWTGRSSGRPRWTATTRSLLQVSVEEAAIADEIFSTLMGDDVESRKGFIQENAKDVRFLDI